MSAPPPDRTTRLVAVVLTDGEAPQALDEWIEAVRPVCDALVTAERVDGRAIQRTLGLGADWVIVLATGERLDPSDARDLGRFLATDAIPGCAYGMQAFTTWPDSTHDPRGEWVYCLFAPRAAHAFESEPSRAVRVPDSPAPTAFVRTTLRLRRPAGDRAPSPLVTPWRARRPGTSVVSAPPVPGDTGTALSWPTADDVPEQGRRRRVACLLPARNCIDDLPGYFESVAQFADRVVALDDGSADGTGEYLERHELVTVVLRNPRRATYREWDDGANRNRLLEASATVEPDWVISLDADERIPPDDGRALRRFIDDEACPGYAYGFNRYRMVDDLDHYDLIEQRAWRLFVYDPGLRFPDRRLHFFPVPTAIPRERWLPTSVRIQHLAGLTEQRRRARREKFREADPDCRWEHDYDYTVTPPGERRAWRARPPGLPVLPTSREAERRVELEPDE